MHLLPLFSHLSYRVISQDWMGGKVFMGQTVSSGLKGSLSKPGSVDWDGCHLVFLLLKATFFSCIFVKLKVFNRLWGQNIRISSLISSLSLLKK